MIRILLSERIKKTTDILSQEVRDKASQVIADVAAAFGDPHRHRGLGLRKLAKSECISNGEWYLFTIKMP